MVWTAPMTAVANTAFTATQFNIHLRDNLEYLKTQLDGNPRALASAAGQVAVATGANALQMRSVRASNATAEVNTSSTSYVTLGGSVPAVTVTTGTSALVLLSAISRNPTAGAHNYLSFAVSGSSSIGAIDDNAALLRTQAADSTDGMSGITYVTGLTAGSNTFTAQYRTDTGTGRFSFRTIAVLPFF